MPDVELIPSEIRAIAATGVRLVPMSGQKIPRIKEWPERASADISQIAAWENEYPHTNWAALTGSENGFWSLDADGETGAQWIAKQIEIHGSDWTATRKVRTGRTTGGFHYYFAWPDKGTVLHSSASKVAPGVDVKGWHGLTVLPPSLHSSGRRYVWATTLDHPILETPEWLIAAVLAASNQSPIPTQTPTENGHHKVQAGERHKFLVSCAGAMRARGMRAESIEAALLVENSISCVPPKTDHQIKKLAQDIANRYDPEPQLIISGKGQPPAPAKLEFETALAFTTQAPVQTSWIIPPFIPAKSLVELVGKLKASGKTTLALLMVKAALDGLPFLDRLCTKSSCVYLTEQPETSLRAALVKAGLQGRDDLHLLRWHKAMGTKWSDIASAAMERAVQVGSKLLVVDTLGQFAQLQNDSENSSSAALEVLRPLQIAQEKGIACLIVRHERKGDAEISDAGRGSSAFSGVVDVMLRLRRLGAGHPANFRRLESLSRFDETPPDVLLELTAEGYQLRQTAAVTLQAAEQSILDVLPASESESLTVLNLIEATKHSRATLQRVLDELVTSGQVRRLGAGQRGCAYRYWKNGGEPCV